MGSRDRFRDKLDRAIADLAERGVPIRLAAPPLWLLSWRVGFRPRPPVFMGFRELFCLCLLHWVVIGVVLAVIFGAWWGPGVAALQIGVFLLIGVPLSLAGADWCRWRARKHHLPDWEDYRPPPARPVARTTPARSSAPVWILFLLTLAYLVAAVIWM